MQKNRLCRAPSHIETEMEDIAIGNFIVGPFNTQFSGIAGTGLALAGDIVVIGDCFGPDKAALEVGVDDAGGLWGAGAF